MPTTVMPTMVLALLLAPCCRTIARGDAIRAVASAHIMRQLSALPALIFN
jgi:hypothetical protein